MNNKEKEDMINTIYRGKFLSERGADPGDIIGPNSGDGFVIFMMVVMFGFLIVGNIYKALT